MSYSSEQTRQRILECAKKEFLEQGYQKANLRKIAEDAKATTGALYNHFKKLYIVKLSERFHKDLATSMNLKPNQMFLTTKYKTQARYFETKELRRILDELINLDANYKSGLIDLNIGLETILCRYCS